MSKLLIVDLDDTLCDTRNRVHHILKESRDWDAYWAGIPQDIPNPWCVDTINGLVCAGYEAVVITGRPDAYRKETRRWLSKIRTRTRWGSDFEFAGNFSDFPLLMPRKNNDYSTPDTLLKKTAFLAFCYGQPPTYDAIVAIEDRKSVAEMWRSLGITCLHCAEGNY